MPLTEIQDSRISSSVYNSNYLKDNNGFINKNEKMGFGYAKSGNYFDKDLQNYNMAKIEEWAAGMFENNLTTLKEQILDMVYPIGSIYLSCEDKNPGSTLGGTWKRIARGRTLVGATNPDTNYEDKHGDLPAGMESTTISANDFKGFAGAWKHTHTTNEAKHNHTINLLTSKDGNHSHNPSTATRRFATVSKGAGISDDPAAALAGSGHIYPFITSGDWAAQDTTGNQGLHDHTVEGTSELSKSNITIAATGSENNVNGNKDYANLPPSFGVYIWKRTN